MMLYHCEVSMYIQLYLPWMSDCCLMSN
jgi:hypothetical protein